MSETIQYIIYIIGIVGILFSCYRLALFIKGELQ